LPQEGKSTTAAALAASIASSARRVLLIDADLRSPSLHYQFGISGERGLANCLDAGVDLGSLIQFDQNSGVSLLPAGAYHPRPLEVLGSPRLRRAIETWRDAFEFILIDAPPVLPIADPRILAPLVDYCVFIARWGRTGWGVLNHGLRLLADSGARIAGIAVSRVDVRRFSTYGFPDASVYGHYREFYSGEE
jgi:capsular exopolysaccharide synthesis family protein